MKHISSIDRGDVKLAYDRAIAHDVEDVADMLEAFAEYIDRLEKQRDELLAALEKIMEEVGRKVLVEEDCGGAFDIEIWPDGLAAFVAARAAIASVSLEDLK